MDKVNKGLGKKYKKLTEVSAKAEYIKIQNDLGDSFRRALMPSQANTVSPENKRSYAKEAEKHYNNVIKECYTQKPNGAYEAISDLEQSREYAHSQTANVIKRIEGTHETPTPPRARDHERMANRSSGDVRTALNHLADKYKDTEGVAILSVNPKVPANKITIPPHGISNGSRLLIDTPLTFYTQEPTTNAEKLLARLSEKTTTSILSELAQKCSGKECTVAINSALSIPGKTIGHATASFITFHADGRPPEVFFNNSHGTPPTEHMQAVFRKGLGNNIVFSHSKDRSQQHTQECVYFSGANIDGFLKDGNKQTVKQRDDIQSFRDDVQRFHNKEIIVAAISSAKEPAHQKDLNTVLDALAKKGGNLDDLEAGQPLTKRKTLMHLHEAISSNKGVDAKVIDEIVEKARNGLAHKVLTPIIQGSVPERQEQAKHQQTSQSSHFTLDPNAAALSESDVSKSLNTMVQDIMSTAIQRVAKGRGRDTGNLNKGKAKRVEKAVNQALVNSLSKLDGASKEELDQLKGELTDVLASQMGKKQSTGKHISLDEKGASEGVSHRLNAFADIIKSERKDSGKRR